MQDPDKECRSTESDSRRFCITDDEILVLARYALRIEDHYSEKAHQPVPMDIEWAKDGLTGELFIVQARPETVHSQDAKDVLLTYYLEQRGTVLAKGKSVGEKIAFRQGPGDRRCERLAAFKPGEILISDTTNPDWEPVMKTAAAIVTNRGGRTCHAAIVEPGSWVYRPWSGPMMQQKRSGPGRRSRSTALRGMRESCTKASCRSTLKKSH